MYPLVVPPCSNALTYPQWHDLEKRSGNRCFCHSLEHFGQLRACAAEDPVRFNTEVMAVLSRAGCNAGACHGNFNGKNGFKLSLRGQDPAADYLSLSRDMLGRRIDPQRPADSLLLLKATASIPHEGGRRFRADSPEYRILANWIAAGMRRDPPGLPVPVALEVSPTERVILDPAEHVRLKATARFSDGSTRDVTRLAAFDISSTLLTISPDGEVHSDQFGETTILVRYLNLRQAVSLAYVKPHADLTWPKLHSANFVDDLVFQKLRGLHLTPSTLCDDGIFLRRANLDLVGVLPSIEATKAFLADTRPEKRSRLIDTLLQRPEFADFWALKWSDILRNEEKTLDRKGVEVFHEWIRQALLENKPLNEFARELIAARGSSYAQPASSFYRALREPSVRGEAAAQVFLGVRLQCALAVTTIRSIDGHSSITTLGPRFSRACNIASWITTVGTNSTNTNSPASRLSGRTIRANGAIRAPAPTWRPSSWAKRHQLSAKMMIACWHWRIGSPSRIIPFSLALKPIGFGITSWAAGWLSPTTIFGHRIRRPTQLC